MRIDTQKPADTEHEESFFERVLDHHHKHRDEPQGDESKDKDAGHEGSSRHDDLKKDEEGLKRYFKEDEKLEEEGQTYGGLM